MNQARSGIKRRVLFMAEAVTLAHVARSVALARTLDPDRYEVQCAWDSRFNHLLGTLAWPCHPIYTLPSTEFLARLQRGQAMHDTTTLRRYVREDLDVLHRVAPDVVVGDFRLSLAVSAPLARVRHVTVANAYWSPYGRQNFDFAEYDYPGSSVLGRSIARRLFRVLLPMGFAMHTRPLNRVRHEHGLTPIGRDIRVMYTFADWTAYADVPEVVPLEGLPANHRHIGATLWSPTVPEPAWWKDLPSDRPLIYVTMGSSGNSEILPVVLDALEGLPVVVMAATAGGVTLRRVPANARVADFLPGTAAAGRAALVICNSGSPTTAQALAAGVPVIGLVSNNMDQQLNMQYVRGAGAGEVLQASRVSSGALRSTAARLLESAAHRAAAARIRDAHQRSRVEERFPQLINDVLQES